MAACARRNSNRKPRLDLYRSVAFTPPSFLLPQPPSPPLSLLHIGSEVLDSTGHCYVPVSRAPLAAGDPGLPTLFGKVEQSGKRPTFTTSLFPPPLQAFLRKHMPWVVVVGIVLIVLWLRRMFYS